MARKDLATLVVGYDDAGNDCGLVIEKLVDDSTGNLIVIAVQATLNDVAAVAGSRGRRVLVPFTQADIGLLERELQRATTHGWT
jgi:hypothetical protein